MKSDADTLNAAAQRMGISTDDLNEFVKRGKSVTYAAGDYLFHESTPRQWLGVVTEGEIELTRGQHGRAVKLGVAQPGAMLGEGVMLDDTPHGASGVARKGAKVWQIPRAEVEALRKEKPDVFYHVVAQVARRLSDRLRAASERIAGETGAPPVSSVRREHDSLGERDVPSHAYYGVQTLRGVENFPLSGIPMSHYQHYIRAFACVKKAAAKANSELGVLEKKIAGAIMKACDEILDGQLHDQFPVDMIQGGAGTS